VLALIAVLVAVLGVVRLLRARFVAVTVSGVSMEPTLSSGDRVLVRRVPLGRVRPGQVVVIANPTGEPPWLVKRAAAVPGDQVDPDWLPAGHAPDRVPAGALVVLGDNVTASYDSRRAGFFPAAALLGVVVRELRLIRKGS
jgi:signal peptidase I